MKLTPTIEAIGYGLSGDIGGLPKNTYYTPDGRVIKAFPDVRGFVRKDSSGKVIESGTRDANLDRGWLLSPPTILKPFCRSCDRWHDTEGEVKACSLNNNKLFSRMEAQVKREEKAHTTDLERQVASLTALVEKLMEGKNGHGALFQSTANEPAQIPRKQRVRKAKKGV